MALIKCPECGHNVSEHANFCPSCGCTIEYIKKHYKMLEEKKIEPKKQTAVSVQTYYSKLSPKPRLFVDRVKRELDKYTIKYVFVNEKEYCGFRKEKNGKLVIYLATHKDGLMYVHLYNEELDKNTGYKFNEDRVEEYFSYVFTRVFIINKQPASGTHVHHSEKEYKYKYAIRDNHIVEIRVDDVINNGSYKIIYYSYVDTNEQHECGANEISSTLFFDKERAIKFLSLRKKESIVPQKLPNGPKPKRPVPNSNSPYYVVYYPKSNSYYCGSHETTNYETYRTNRGNNMSSGAKYEVPDFTLDIKKATRFYYVETAEEIVAKYNTVINGILVVKKMSN